MSKVLGAAPNQEALGTLALKAPPLRVWGGEITKGLSLPQAVSHWGAPCNLDMVPVLPDPHPKVKERALDLSLPLRPIRRSDSSSMAAGG